MKLSHQNDNFFTYRWREQTKIDGVSINDFISTLLKDKLRFWSFLQYVKLQKKSKIFLLRLFSWESIPKMEISDYKEMGRDIIFHFENISIEDFIKFSFMRKLFSNLNMNDIERVKIDIEEEMIRRFYDLLTKHFSQLWIHPKIQERICSDFEHILPKIIVNEVQENVTQIVEKRV